jgi:hypothetical protein
MAPPTKPNTKGNQAAKVPTRIKQQMTNLNTLKKGQKENLVRDL